MQQFGPQFINNHLMPLLEEMLTDTVLRKKDYLDKLFINGVLEEAEKKNLMDYYFNPARKNAGVPFVGSEESRERENFLKHFVEYVRSRGAKPEDRIRAFLPVQNQKSEGPVKVVVWPAEVKRNLFLMSYHIAENFEHDKIQEIIAAKEAAGSVEEAKKDRELLEKGQLMLVKDPATGEYTKYIRATELKAGETAVPFLPPPTPEMATMMEPGFAMPSPANLQAIGQGAASPQAVAKPNKYEPKPAAEEKDEPASNDELVKSFQKKRGKAIVNKLKKEGFEVLGDVQFDANGHAVVKVKSGKDTMLVAVDTRVPPDQDLKFTFTFQDGPTAGKSFTVTENKMDEAFHKLDGSQRGARELYDDIDLQKKLGIKSDAYPEKAPNEPKPLPKPLLAAGVKAPGEGIKLPSTLGPGMAPGGGDAVAAAIAAELEAGPVRLPTGYRAPTMPKAATPKPVAGGVVVKAPPKPAAGIPVGSVMEAKAKMKQQQEDQELGAAGPLVAVAPPVAPGRVVTPTGGGAKPAKSSLGKIAVISNVLGIGVATGAGAWMGSATSADPTATAFHSLKNVWIAIAHYLPNLFS